VESLCRSLTQLADSLRAKSLGEVGGPEVPGSLDTELSGARTALQTELAALRAPPKKKGSEKKGRVEKEALNEASVLRAAWRALYALQGQLELATEKQKEYAATLSSLRVL
jgi:hypothetical protein